MKELLIVKTPSQTCNACPSQWEGHLSNGKMIYIRYRWGTLTADISKNATDDIYDAIGESSDEIFYKKIGDEFDGTMGTTEMLKHLSDIVKVK